MVAVREITWEEASAPGFEQTTRQAWRAAVADIAAKARTKSPECRGRVDSAVKLVLAGDVELLPDGTAQRCTLLDDDHCDRQLHVSRTAPLLLCK